jgi:hypothetical protein
MRGPLNVKDEIYPLLFFLPAVVGVNTRRMYGLSVGNMCGQWEGLGKYRFFAKLICDFVTSNLLAAYREQCR